MGQVLHGSARTTAAVRRAIQESEESCDKCREISRMDKVVACEDLLMFWIT